MSIGPASDLHTSTQKSEKNPNVYNIYECRLSMLHDAKSLNRQREPMCLHIVVHRLCSDLQVTVVEVRVQGSHAVLLPAFIV